MPYINNKGVRIHYEIEGNGPPLVLHHGLSDSIGSWYEFDYVTILKSEFQMIMIEPRGHGESDKPHDPAAYASNLMASDVIAVLDALRLKRVYYAGYSLGCRVGFEIARQAPERIRSFVMGGNHPYFSSLQFFRTVFDNGLDAWLQLIEATAGPLSKSTRERLMSNDIDALRAIVAHDRLDISEVLPSITASCRLFVGGDDARYENTKRAAFDLPNGDFVPLQGLNHFQSFLRGDIVAPLIIPDIILLKSVDTGGHRPALALST